MADESFELDVFRDLLEEARVVAQLARGEKSYVTAHEALRAGDRKAFQAALKRLKLVPHCHLVCEWIRIKECALLCLELCGPPKVVERPNPRVLAQAIVKITSDERLVKQLAQAVEKRDRAAFQRIVRAHKLEPICHLFCHWVCYVHFRLLCRWVCRLEVQERPSLVAELKDSGQALRALLENRQAFDEAVAASQAGDAEKFRSVIEAAGLIRFCRFICFFFCSWRCVLVCLTLCRQFPLKPIEQPLQEALAFAKEVGKLAQKPAELERLSAAVGAGDPKAFAAIVEELKLQRFCFQLCHWICFLRCQRFCFRVCPDPYNNPIFTHVGNFAIYADFDAAGRTNKPKAGHGGPDFGFFGCLELRGFCPKTILGEQTAYRFLFQEPGAPNPTPITGPFVCEVTIGSRLTLWKGDPNAVQSVSIRGSGTTSPTPPPDTPDATPPEHYIVPDSNGWIPVDPNALDNGFGLPLTGFASWVAFPGAPDADPAPGVPAGTAVPVGNQKNGVHPAIIFEATRVSKIGAPPPDYTNQLSNIHINNWLEVSLLDLQEFLAPGATCCSPLTTDLHILYTADHELMAEWFIDMVTCPPGPSPAPTFPSGIGPRGGAGTDFHDISTWPMCSYLIRLFTRRSLTTGLEDDDLDDLSFKTFCIGPRRR